jgi:magnesium chelatase accessory protein
MIGPRPPTAGAAARVGERPVAPGPSPREPPAHPPPTGPHDRLDWSLDGHDWPHRGCSHFVSAGGLQWHLQDFPGPVGADPGAPVLLLHGTGSATHSWRTLAPLLAQTRRVLAPDLPGHGFTDPLGDGPVSPQAMARAVGTLIEALQVQPWRVIGHSAGAAIAVRMALDGLLDADATPGGIVSLNGALVPLTGFAWTWFSPAARLLASSSLPPRLMAWRARDPAVVHRLLDGTGSVADDVGRRLYTRLVRSPGHVTGALRMMAGWDLDALRRDLPRLHRPAAGTPRRPPALHLVVGDRDRLVPPAVTRQVRTLVPSATLQVLPGLGHLAHEEAAATVAGAIAALPGAR